MSYNKETGMYEGYIYIILNDIYPEKLYIGQTSQTVEKRWQGHRRQIKEHTHTDKLHNLMAKYGVEHFGCECIEKCTATTKDLLIKRLNEKEKYYIKRFDAFYNGLNATKGGRDAMDHKKRSVKKYTLYGEFVAEYESVDELKEFFNSVSTIYDCCLGNCKYAYGSIWRYSEDELIKYPLPNNEEIKESIVRMKMNSLIDKYDYRGRKILTYKNAKDVCLNEGITLAKIYKLCTGENIMHNMYIYRFSSDTFNTYKTYSIKPKIVEQYDLQGNFIKAYYGVREAGRKNNINYQNIVAACSGKCKQSCGFIWRYYMEI